MTNMIKYLKLGAKAVDVYDYDGLPLSFRPLYTWELDDALEKSLEGASVTTINLIVKLRLQVNIDEKELQLDNPEQIREMQHHLLLLDYWIVYHGIKDFQPSEFSEIDVETGNPRGFDLIRTKFKYVHEIATKILAVSKPPDAVVREVVKSSEGKVIATIHYRFNVPLVSKQWEMTPFQRDFLILSNPIIQEEAAISEARDKVAIKSGMTLEEAMKRLGVDIDAIDKRIRSCSKRKSRGS